VKKISVLKDRARRSRGVFALLVVLASLVLVPTSAGASQVFASGWCEYNRIADTVSLVARVHGSTVQSDVQFSFMGKNPSDPDYAEFSSIGEYRVHYYQDHNNYDRYRFRSMPRPAEGWVYRLDVYIPADNLRLPRLAFYNDEVTRIESCRIVGEET
jgi:hypothetical protein